MAVLTASRCPLGNVARTLVLIAATVAAALSSGVDPSVTLRDAASRGDAQAQFELGNAYWMKDNVVAASWWRKAAEQGHAEAQFALAGPYSVGLGVPKDHAVAVAWLRKAAEQGLAEAQFVLGLGYELGSSATIPHDLIFAVYWYRKAADGGHVEAREHLDRYPDRAALFDDAQTLFSLGLAYIPGIDAEANVTINGADGSAESAALWREAAELGHVNAQFMLAQYLLADGRDLDEGMAWGRKAAENGHTIAQFTMYYSPELDLVERVAWLRKAAEGGHARAQCSLAAMYWLGEGVPRDRVTSYAWLNLYSSMGGTTDDGCPDVGLDDIEAAMTHEEVAEAQALSRELHRRIERRTGAP